MPRYELTDDQILDETETLFLEQAKAFFLELRHAAQHAPKGKVIRNVELLAFEKGRELLRQTTESIVQEQNDVLEKKKELRQCNCGRKRAHLGYRPHHTLTSVGKIKTRRLYCGCVLCKLNVHPTDALLGIEDDYSVGLRDLAVFAAADSSFAKAEKRLKKFCGISISENTIKRLCDQESVKMEQWQQTDVRATLPFRNSYGELEFTTDGTMVNTLDGWREMCIGIFSRRELGHFALPREWETRHLPRPHISVAFAAMEDKDTFRRRWTSWAYRLKIRDQLDTMSVLGDGAHWIWDASKLAFGKTKENLDIYHALENLSNCGKVLYKAESPEFAAWQEKSKWLLLEEGYEGVHQYLQQQIEWQKAEPQNADGENPKLKTLERVEGYLTWHKDRLGYRERLSEGRAIGSGQVEGACKSMIGARLKQTGARWRTDRVNKMGVVCALFYGDQWDDYWKYAK